MLDQKPRYVAGTDFGHILSKAGRIYYIDKVYVKKYPFGLLREVKERVYSEFKPLYTDNYHEYKERQQAVLKALNGTE